tara:strand:- start:106 stop:1101 length:996 start_codon:yes stop_codon:yes gene_type:complete
MHTHTLQKTNTFDRKNLRNKAELIVGISNWCNYDCSYCMPHSKSRTSKLDNADKIIEIINKSYHHFKKYAQVDNYGVLFVGGEPTIHPDFNTIINSIQNIRSIEINYKIIIVSNLSRTKKWWSKICDKVTGIVASYHDEFANLDEFTDKIILMMQQNNNLHITIGIQPLPGKLEKLEKDCFVMRDRITEEIGLDHADRKLDFIIQHLYQGMDKLYPYSEHDFAMFKKLINEFSNPNISAEDRLSEQEDFLVHSFTDKKDEYLDSYCYAGVEGLTVGFTGNLQRTSRCELSDSKKILGNIYTDYTLPTDPVLCDVKNGCGNCWFDYSFRKAK